MVFWRICHCIALHAMVNSSLKNMYLYIAFLIETDLDLCRPVLQKVIQILIHPMPRHHQKAQAPKKRPKSRHLEIESFQDTKQLHPLHLDLLDLVVD